MLIARLHLIWWATVQALFRCEWSVDARHSCVDHLLALAMNSNLLSADFLTGVPVFAFSHTLMSSRPVVQLLHEMGECTTPSKQDGTIHLRPNWRRRLWCVGTRLAICSSHKAEWIVCAGMTASIPPTWVVVPPYYWLSSWRQDFIWPGESHQQLFDVSGVYYSRPATNENCPLLLARLWTAPSLHQNRSNAAAAVLDSISYWCESQLDCLNPFSQCCTWLCQLHAEVVSRHSHRMPVCRVYICRASTTNKPCLGHQQAS